MYYSVASNAGIGQSPYPFVGRCLGAAVVRNKTFRGGGSPFASKCAPALRYDSIITQIGRENDMHPEIYVSRTVEDAGPYKL